MAIARTNVVSNFFYGIVPLDLHLLGAHAHGGFINRKVFIVDPRHVRSMVDIEII